MTLRASSLKLKQIKTKFIWKVAGILHQRDRATIAFVKAILLLLIHLKNSKRIQKASALRKNSTFIRDFKTWPFNSYQIRLRLKSCYPKRTVASLLCTREELKLIELDCLTLIKYHHLKFHPLEALRVEIQIITILRFLLKWRRKALNVGFKTNKGPGSK